jgi:hypothetical protein
VKRNVAFGQMFDERLIDRSRPIDGIELLKAEAHSELKFMRHSKSYRRERRFSLPKLEMHYSNRIVHDGM